MSFPRCFPYPGLGVVIALDHAIDGEAPLLLRTALSCTHDKGAANATSHISVGTTCFINAGKPRTATVATACGRVVVTAHHDVWMAERALWAAVSQASEIAARVPRITAGFAACPLSIGATFVTARIARRSTIASLLASGLANTTHNVVISDTPLVCRTDFAVATYLWRCTGERRWITCGARLPRL
jgi:hypothetical protein